MVMPVCWMDAAHRLLGMGPLPAGPVVGYLARSTSAFYAMVGGLLILVSFDIARHRRALAYLGAVHVAFGLALLATDIAEGMPLFWTLAEGPANAAIGVGILVLLRGSGRKTAEP
jgi:hypothetical protein